MTIEAVKVCPIRVFDVGASNFHEVREFHKLDKGKIRILLNGVEIKYCFLFNLDTGECGYYLERESGKGPYVDPENPNQAARRIEIGNLEYYDGEGQRWV